MKKNVRTLLIYLFFMGVMMLVFINLDYLIGRFLKIGNNDLKQVDFAAYQAMGKDTIYFTLDSIQFETDDFETATFTGRCCADTKTDNSKKMVTILFRSQDTCYASERRSSMGPPPSQAAGALGYNHSYTRDIALLPLAKGSYEIWLFDWENEENYGLVYTNYGIIKDEDGIRLKERTVPPPAAEADIYTDAYSCLDYVKEADSHTLALEGWIYQEDTETQGQSVYLQLSTEKETKYILCDPVVRSGVAKAFGNEKYGDSGFIGYTDRAWVGNSPLTIQIIMKNENGFCSSDVIYQWATSAAEGGEVTSKKKEKLRYRPATFLQDAPLNVEAAQPAMRYWLDYIKTEGDQYLVEGWIVAENQETLGQQVYFEIQTETAPLYVKCDPVVRTGVGDALKSQLYDNSGYICRLAAEYLPSDGFDFRIFMKNDVGIYTDGQLHYFDPSTGEYG